MSFHSACFVLLGGLALAGTAPAQEYELLADINPAESDPGSDPEEFVTLGSQVFFVATADGVGRELFRTDGTPSGTRLVVDLYPGANSSWPSHLTVLQGRLYFMATDATHGRELWTSDGTAQGTRLVAETVLGSGSFGIGSLTAAGQLLFLRGQRTVFCYDPNTSAILDLQDPGLPPRFVPESSRPVAGTPAGYYFFADDGVHGTELWFSDGTRAGTRLVVDQWPGSRSTGMRRFAPLGNGVVMVCQTTLTNIITTTYYVDAALPKPVLLESAESLQELPQFEWIASSGGHVWFAELSSGALTRRIWVAEANPGSLRILRSARQGMPEQLYTLGEFNGLTYFLARDPQRVLQVWRSDGTPAGTDIAFPAPFVHDRYSKAAAFCVAGGRFYFTLDYAVLPYRRTELWQSDGTLAGTSRCPQPAQSSEILDPFSSAHAAPLGSKLVLPFTGTGAVEPWVTDGTAQGTVLLANPVAPAGLGSSKPLELNAHDGRVYFGATHYLYGRELWVTDGTPQGTHMAFDLNPGYHSGGASRLYSALGKLFFQGYDEILGFRTFVTDGTLAGTQQLPEDLCKGDFTSSKAEFDGLWFAGEWVTDGTPAGTLPLDQVVSGHPAGMTCDRVARAGDKLYLFFASPTQEQVIGLLTPGSRQLQLLGAPIKADHYPVGDLGGALIYRRLSYQSAGLWSSRGTPATTVQLGTDDVNMAVVHQDRLWILRKTAAGTQDLSWRDARSPGETTFASFPSTKVYIERFVATGDWLWFSVKGTANDDGFYVSDGTAQGTVRLTPFVPHDVTSTGPRSVWFDGPGPYYETEPWTSDGTKQGTYAVAQRHAVVPVAVLAFGAPVGGRVTIVGKSVQHGLELFVQKHGPGRHPLGRRCGEDSPWLDTSLPRLGQTLQIEGGSAPQGSAGIVLLGGDPSAPLPLPGVDCRLYVDPTQLAWAQPFAVTQPHWQLGLAVPNVPGLAGLRLAVQSVYLSPSLALQASEGIQLLLGR